MNSQEEQAQPVLVAFKLNFLNTCKWVQLPQNGFDFQSLKEISKKKFPEISLDATIFTDEEGVEIEEDFLESFIKLKGDKFLINIISTTTMSPEKTAPTIQILTVDQALQLQALSSSSSTVTFASPSGSTDNSVEPFNDFNPDGEGEPSGEPKKIYISAEELKTFLIQFKNCKYIFDEYEKSQLLSNDTRKKLVRAVANLMEENHMEITPKVLIHYSEALVELFPQYKAVNSKYPFEAFYNPISHGGFLSWRIKNNRRKSGEKCKQKRPVEESEVPEKKIQLCDDLEEKIIFLRNVNPVQRDAIRQKMIETFSYRRSAPEKILEEFPRFLDTPGLIDLDFSLLYPNAEDLSRVIPNLADKIISVYIATNRNPSKDIVSNDEDQVTWDKSTRAILALLSMLPPTARGRCKGIKDNVETAKNKLLLFKKVNVPKEEVIPQSKIPVQPLIIAEGSNIGSIHSYDIYIDNRFIPCSPGASSAEAIATLFKTFFVFQVKYDQSLISFYSFIQLYLAKIKPNKSDQLCQTARMTELACQLGLS